MKLRLALAATATFAFAATAFAADEARKPDVAKGRQISETVCAACHGADGNPPTPAYPKLAGQLASYTLKQLMNFKAAPGKEPERKNAIMNGIVATLSPDDMRNVAAFYATQKEKPGVAKNKDTVVLGQSLFRGGAVEKGLPACAGCHGPNGLGVPNQYPGIANQWTDYTVAQLKAFRAGERANDPQGMMRAVASKMTDAEINAVADYVAGLR